VALCWNWLVQGVVGCSPSEGIYHSNTRSVSMWSIVCEGKQEDGQWQLTGWAVFQTKNFKISWLKYAWEKSLKIMAALQNTVEDSLNVPQRASRPLRFGRRRLSSSGRRQLQATGARWRTRLEVNVIHTLAQRPSCASARICYVIYTEHVPKAHQS